MTVTRASGKAGLRSRRRRRGAVMVESAIVYSVLLMMVIGTMVMGLGIFRYQQIAALAREGSRWASVHGPTYQTENNAAAPTDQDVKTAILARAVILNSSALQCDLDQQQLQAGVASVVLTYTWTPEAYFSPIKMTSKSVMTVTY